MSNYDSDDWISDFWGGSSPDYSGDYGNAVSYCWNNYSDGRQFYSEDSDSGGVDYDRDYDYGSAGMDEDYWERLVDVYGVK